MSTANFGVFYTQAGGGGILPTDLAYVDANNTFTQLNTFLSGLAIEGQANINVDATTGNGLVRLSQAQDLIVTAIDGFSADANEWVAPQTFDAKVYFNGGALFEGVAPQSNVDVTGSPDPTVIPNKAYVDAVVADAVGVRTDVANVWSATQTFGDLGAGLDVGIQSYSPCYFNNGIQVEPSVNTGIIGGNGQLAVGGQQTDYIVDMEQDPFTILGTSGTPNITYMGVRNTGSPALVNLPSNPEDYYGKRITFICVGDTLNIQHQGTGYIRAEPDFLTPITNVSVPLGACVTFIASTSNGGCWIELSAHGTTNTR